MWIPVLYCNARFILQVFRPLVLPILIMGIILINIVDLTNHIADRTDAAALRNVFNAVGALIALVMLWSIHEDSILQRAWFGVKSKVVEGIYYKDSEFHRKLVEESPRLRERHKSTPWACTGDLRTLIPFMLFSHDHPEYVRRWLTMEDGEACALDFALPPGGYDRTKPFIIVLHGLNGGSTEPYVLDLVHRALELGHGVVVMVARGLMQTPIVKGRAFTGGRISDLHATVQLVRNVVGVGGSVAIVGYSMGGLIAANYAALAPPQSGVVGVVALSASCDLRSNMDYQISRRVWQPILTLALKQNLIIPCQHLLSHPGPSRLEIDIRRLESACDIVQLDSEFTAKYGGWQSVGDYYDDASCGAKGKLESLKIPLCLLHAEDDPILPVDGMIPALDCIRRAQEGKSQGGANLFVVITREGGHVGWPEGVNPMKNKWAWMSESILQFVGGAARHGPLRVAELRKAFIENAQRARGAASAAAAVATTQSNSTSITIPSSLDVAVTDYDAEIERLARMYYPSSTIEAHDLGKFAPTVENPIPAEIEMREQQKRASVVKS